MKIGPYTIHSPLTRLREQALDVDTAPMYSSPSTVSYKVVAGEVNQQYELYCNHDLVRGMIDDLAESACGQGIYNTVEKLSPIFARNRSKELCDDFGKQFNLDEMLPKIAKNILIAGFCPVETKLSSEIEKCLLKVVHPRTITDIQTDPYTGEVLQVKQKVKDKEQVLSGKNLAWFTYGNLANDPRGLSFIISITNLLQTLDNTTNLVTAISERYLAPITVWKSRLASADLKRAVESRKEGDAIFLGSLTPDEMREETVRIYQVDPRVAFWEVQENLQVRLYAYSRASNLWMTRNANLASAEKLEDIVARHVASIQRNIKRTIERVWYTPLIDLNGFEEVPRVNFGKEPTGVEDITPSDIINKGLDLGYINKLQFYEIMRQIGVKITEMEDPEEPQQNQDETDQQNQEEPQTDEENPNQTEKPVEKKPQKQETKAYDEWIIRKRRPKPN